MHNKALSVNKNNKKELNIFYKILIFNFFIFNFSWNYHSLWGAYDLSLFYLLTKFNYISLIKKAPLFFISLSLLLLSFLWTLRGGIHLISFLSIWDSTKHLILLLFIFNNKEMMIKLVLSKKINAFLKIIISIFLIQTIIITYQYFNIQIVGSRFDNVSGLLGDGSTHAIGYFSIFMLFYCIKTNKFKYLILLLPLTLFINYFGSNQGFYILLTFLMFYLFLDFSKIKIKSVFLITIIISVIIGIVYVINIDVIITFYKSVESRLLGALPNFINSTDFSGFDQVRIKSGRSGYLNFAYFLGGYDGVGYGAYSMIYSQSGWLVSSIRNVELNITEGSHLIAETGIIGFSFIIITYLSIIQKIIIQKKMRYWWSFFFIVNLFYARFLMDERLIYFFILMLFVEIICTSPKNKKVLLTEENEI